MQKKKEMPPVDSRLIETIRDILRGRAKRIDLLLDFLPVPMIAQVYRLNPSVVRIDIKDLTNKPGRVQVEAASNSERTISI